ncbi:hypothetical protein rosag_06320 [Roseisolibacter agri]|uniref:Uncharacterized protein n=1 Tax=Roseisolibacter agri TaxID=2014610 RepID=A0AA37VDS5_9BACT|nr:hypothetical protein rosag_06320 [Roseisolibacter agri]
MHRRIFPPVNRPSRSDDASSPDRAPRPARARCPRCGASLGRLDVDAAADAGGWYCGCCGLVVPDASVSPAPR